MQTIALPPTPATDTSTASILQVQPPNLLWKGKRKTHIPREDQEVSAIETWIGMDLALLIQIEGQFCYTYISALD